MDVCMKKNSQKKLLVKLQVMSPMSVKKLTNRLNHLIEYVSFETKYALKLCHRHISIFPFCFLNKKISLMNFFVVSTMKISNMTTRIIRSKNTIYLFPHCELRSLN